MDLEKENKIPLGERANLTRRKLLLDFFFWIIVVAVPAFLTMFILIFFKIKYEIRIIVYSAIFTFTIFFALFLIIHHLLWKRHSKLSNPYTIVYDEENDEFILYQHRHRPAILKKDSIYKVKATNNPFFDPLAQAFRLEPNWMGTITFYYLNKDGKKKSIPVFDVSNPHITRQKIETYLTKEEDDFDKDILN